MKTFAERLIAAMTATGLSQGQLAERVGLSQPAIQKMTSGKTNGSRKMVELSRALSVRPEWLPIELNDITINEISRAGLTCDASRIYMDNPEDILRISGLVLDSFEYVKNDENFRKK